MSAIYFVREASGVGKAVFRPTDDAQDVFCAAVALDAYDDPHVCANFAALVNAVAAYRRRTHAVGVVAPVSRLDGLPCASCEAPEADDVRFRAADFRRERTSIEPERISGRMLSPADCRCFWRQAGYAAIGRAVSVDYLVPC